MANSSETRDASYLSVDLGEGLGRLSWRNYDAAFEWLEDLRRYWQWMSPLRMSPADHAWNRIAQLLDDVKHQLHDSQHRLARGEADAANSTKHAACKSIASFARQHPWLLEKHPTRLWLDELRSSGKEKEAGLVVAHLLGNELTGVPIQLAIAAVLNFELFQRGSKDRVRAERNALAKISGELQSLLTQQAELASSEAGRFEGLFQSYLDQQTRLGGEFETHEEERAKRFDESLAEAQERLKRLEETYNKHMALAAPVGYWEGKQQRHRKMAVRSFVAVCISMLILAGGLIYELHSVTNHVSHSVQVTVQAEAAPGKGEMPSAVVGGKANSLGDLSVTWRLGSFLLLATLGFWLIRILVRIFLSNLHLENDAAERVTMVKTYLAMIRDGALPTGENLGTVLAALFRPTGDGIVKDEGLPPTAMEWATKLGGK